MKESKGERTGSKKEMRKSLKSINEGVDALLSAAQNPNPEQRTIFYNEIGKVLLDGLPVKVTDLRLTPEVVVSRDAEKSDRKEWTLFKVEDYAGKLADKTGEKHKNKFTRKKKSFETKKILE
jgi:hypothetical protein